MNFSIIKNSYNFECTKCGNCCTGDQKVNLNPYDLYKMARYKGFNHTKDLFDSRLVHLVKSQNNAWIPQIKFKSVSKKKLKFCPFLVNQITDDNKLLGLCSLHPNLKPLICSMSPVGRVLDFKQETEQYIFVKPATDCPGVERKKANNLVEQIESKKDELDYEKRFIKILDYITLKNIHQKIYIDHLYYFYVHLPFKKIILNLEKIPELSKINQM